MGKPRQLALIGASVRAAAESAARAGHGVIGIDCFGDVDTLEACRHHVSIQENEVALDAATQTAIQCLPTRPKLLSVGGLKASPGQDLQSSLGSWFAEWQGHDERVALVRDHRFLNQVADRRFKVPATRRFAPNGSDRDLQGSQPARRWLHKSHGSCGGLGVRWLDASATLSRATSCQAWVEGRPFGISYLSNGTDVVLLGACRSLFTRLGSLPFVYAGSVGPIGIPDSDRDDLIRLGRRIVDRSGLTGLFNADLMLEPEGNPWLLEINPRWSGSSELIDKRMEQCRPDRPLMQSVVEAMDGLAIDAEASDDVVGEAVFLKRIVFARRTIRFARSLIENRLAAYESIHDIPSDGQQIRAGEPVCTLIRNLSANEKAPMRRHRGLIRFISGMREEDHSPRSSA